MLSRYCIPDLSVFLHINVAWHNFVYTRQTHFPYSITEIHEFVQVSKEKMMHDIYLFLILKWQHESVLCFLYLTTIIFWPSVFLLGSHFFFVGCFSFSLIFSLPSVIFSSVMLNFLFYFFFERCQRGGGRFLEETSSRRGT
jgi:hypothetical protein